MKRFTVYLRVAVVLIVVGSISLVLFKNRAHTVNVWLFGLTDPNEKVNVVWVMVATSVVTLLAWWLTALGRGLIHDLREVARERAAAVVKKEADRRVAELDVRQKRVEEQLHRNVTEGKSDKPDDDM